MTHEEEVRRNYEAFKLVLPELLSTYRGQYALMQGGEVLDFYTTSEKCYRAGVERYGHSGWSMQKITDEVVSTPTVFLVLPAGDTEGEHVLRSWEWWQ